MPDDDARLVARFDGWTLRRTPLELFKGDQPVKLQEQPLQILEALLHQPGELVTREALAANLWPDSVVDFEAGLNTAVRKLRAPSPTMPRRRNTWRPCRGRAIASSARSNGAILTR
jgi:DNA-binding response OmpR family regulator